MKSKKNVLFFAFIAIFFTIIYVIIAAKPLPKEYQFQPVWKQNITTQPSAQNENTERMYFKLGSSVGYFSNDGNILLYKPFPAKASISDYYYALYNADEKNIQIYNNKGEKSGLLKKPGFPYFSEDQIYLMLPGGTSFEKCNDNGLPLWKYSGIMPITAFKGTKSYTLLGFADGTIKMLDNTSGETELEFLPGGSDSPVILGLDITDSGDYIAAVCGHNKQRFILAHKEEKQPKIIFHAFLNSETYSQTVVHFTKDNERVIYNYNNYIGIYDIKKEKHTVIPIESKIISIEESGNLIFLLGKKDNTYTVYIVEKSNILEGKFSFVAETAFIRASNNCLYIGKDDSISKITLNRE